MLVIICISLSIAICTSYNELVASNSNGSMVGLKANSNEMVSEVYNKAIELGGSCEGKPDERRQGVFAAYFRDLDHNKFGIFCVEDVSS